MRDPLGALAEEVRRHTAATTTVTWELGPPPFVYKVFQAVEEEERDLIKWKTFGPKKKKDEEKCTCRLGRKDQ